MKGFWRVTIKYVNIRVIYTLNKVIHSRTWSNIIVTDRYKCKNGLCVECRVQILFIWDPIRCAFYIPELWFLIGPEDG